MWGFCNLFSGFWAWSGGDQFINTVPGKMVLWYRIERYASITNTGVVRAFTTLIGYWVCCHSPPQHEKGFPPLEKCNKNVTHSKDGKKCYQGLAPPLPPRLFPHIIFGCVFHCCGRSCVTTSSVITRHVTGFLSYSSSVSVVSYYLFDNQVALAFPGNSFNQRAFGLEADRFCWFLQWYWLRRHSN